MSDESRLLRMIVIILIGAAVLFGGIKLAQSASDQTAQQSQQLEDINHQ